MGVTANGKALSAKAAVYAVENVTADVEVVVTVKKVVPPVVNWHEVTFSEGEGYEVTAIGLTDGKVKDGEGFSFVVDVAEGWELVGVTANGKALTAQGGVYSVENVAGDVEIAVTVKKTEKPADPVVVWHEVSFSEGEGYAVTAIGLTDGKVEQGKSFSFVVSVEDGYELVKVTANGEAIVAAGGLFTLQNVTSDIKIAVEVKKTEAPVTVWHEVSFSEGEGYEVTAIGLIGGKIKEGETLSFVVSVEDGWELVKVTANGEALTAQGGVYSVENVAGDVEIAVTVKKTEKPADPVVVWHEVSFSEGEGYAVTAIGLTDGKVEQGKSFSFVVSVEDGYELVKVTANGEALAAQVGVYSVENVTGPVAVEVYVKAEEPFVLPIESAAVEVVADVVYDAEAQLPAITVVLDGKTLVAGVDYTVEYANNIEVGTATATIKGIGLYTGTKSIDYEVTHLAVVGLFTDFKDGAWYLDENQGAFAGLRTLYMDYALASGLMSGYKNADGSVTSFGPWDSLDRAQAATIIYRMAVEDASATVDPAKYADNATDMADVESGKYYTAAVNWCVENGVITGYQSGPNAGKFKPYSKVTRQELATMIQRYCVKVCGAEDVRADVMGYADSGKIDTGWALPGLEFCKAAGVMSGVYGTNNLNPAGTANRAEAAKMFSVVGHDIL